MRFLDGLFRPSTETKTDVPPDVVVGPHAQTSVGSSWSGGYRRRSESWDVARAMTEGYDAVSWVYRSVNKIAEELASLPIALFDGRSSRSANLLDDQDDPLLPLLNIRASTESNAWDFRFTCVAQGLLSRRGVFIEVIRDRLGRPIALWNLPPQMMSPRTAGALSARKLYELSTQTGTDYDPDDHRLVVAFAMQTDSGELTIPRYYPDGTTRIAWYRKPHPGNPLVSHTPLEAAGISATIDYYSRVYNLNFLMNDGRPGVLLNVRGDIDDEDADELKRRFSGGPGAAGRTSVIEADGVDVVDTAISPRDAQYVESRRITKEDVLGTFGMPESVVTGNAADRTFANADTEQEIAWLGVYLPEASSWDRFWDELSFGADLDGRWLLHNFSGVGHLERAHGESEERHQRALAAGGITPNEYREVTGRDPLDSPYARALHLGPLVAFESEVDARLANAEPVAPGAPVVEGAPGEKSLQMTTAPFGLLDRRRDP